MSEYAIKRIGAENFELLIPLMKDCFGMNVNLEYFHWKYIQNPAGSFIGFVAIEEKSCEVAAYYGVIPQNFYIGDKEQTIFQSCDTMTHSKHRRKGLFKMLALECYDYLRKRNELFIIGFGGADSTPGFIKFGWKHLFNFRYSFKPAIFCKLAELYSFPKSNFSEEPSIEILNEVTKNFHGSEKIHSPRTAAHILWRTKNNNYNYQFIFFRKKNQVFGYVVYYVNDNKLILFDFIFKNNEARKALIWRLCKIVNLNNYRAIIGYCQENSIYESLLRKSLFISNPFNKGPLVERTPFIFYADEENLKKYNFPNGWFVTSYDHDAL